MVHSLKLNDLKQTCNCFVGKIKPSSSWNICPVNCFYLLLISFRTSWFVKNFPMSNFLGQTLSSLIVGTSGFDCHRVALRLMSKKIKNIYEGSLVLNLFHWLTIQTTFEIDSIHCNCIFKVFSKQCCLDYHIKRKKCSCFIETYRAFPWASKTFPRIFLPSLWTDETVMFALVEWTLCFEHLPFCLFNISELKDLIFHDTQLIIVYKNHNISYYIAIFDRVQDLIY